MGTLQPAKRGGFGVFPQEALGTEATGSEFYWFKHNMTNIGVQQIMRDLGQLVGGSLLPAGQVKAGVFNGGRLTMPPALDDQLWWLFYALAGAQEATPDDNLNGTYTHYAPSKAGLDTTTPELFLTAHKSIPTSGLKDMGENFVDVTVARCQLAIAGGQFVTTQWDFIGKGVGRVEITKASREVGWAMTGAKGQASVPIAAVGQIQLPVAADLEGAQAMTIDIVNAVPGFDDVAQIASYFPHSFPVLNRIPVVNYRQLYHSKELYESVFFDAAGNWNPVVYTTSLLVRADSPAYVRAVVDSEQGSLSYTGSAGSESFTDDTQDFQDYQVTPPTDATHWIEVTNADGLVAWAYCGAAAVATAIDVYKDKGTTVRGWNCEVDPTGGTPSSYNIYPVARYGLGFKAMKINWNATPVPLEGGDLIRLDVNGRLAESEAGLDWHLFVTNKTASYTWPTP